ncbi:NAD(P)H-dependent oxidoreductase subunit E [Clostridium lundense]|uniref:NAD(P)H-dependent oxidoreductase subunit E n=1 Tax=Clostridium lundense TaxID=319475 RepID=UPI000486B2E7|nr:NAD(P)H-dependent oxidoreductase subunit E [Clostridium lundense]
MVTINVCVGSACHLKGSYKVIRELQKLIESYKVTDKVELKGAFCLGNCTEGVSVKIDDKIYSVNESNVESFFKEQVLGRIQQ